MFVCASPLDVDMNKTDQIAGPSGFEPETAGFLRPVKSPVLYLAELRALFNLSLVYGIIYLFMPIVESLSE